MKHLATHIAKQLGQEDRDELDLGRMVLQANLVGAEMITEHEGRPDLVTTAWRHIRPESGQEHDNALREASRPRREHGRDRLAGRFRRGGRGGG